MFATKKGEEEKKILHYVFKAVNLQFKVENIEIPLAVSVNNKLRGAFILLMFAVYIRIRLKSV